MTKKSFARQERDRQAKAAKDAIKNSVADDTPIWDELKAFTSIIVT